MSSSPEVDHELRVTVKRVDGGAVSTWLTKTLKPGDLIESTCPAGVFTLDDTNHDGDLIAFAGGSGITPVFSLLKSALATTSRTVRLLYANRDSGAVIFREQLDALSERYRERLQVVHHFDSDRGFVQGEDVFPFVGTANAEYYICGPGPFMDLVEEALHSHDVESRQIHIERFTPPAAVEVTTQEAVAGEDPAPTQITITLNGKTLTASHRPGTTPGVNAINYASRIENLADAGQIILSEATYKELGTPPFACKEWPKRFLKGIQTLETVYELDYDGIRRPEPGTRFIPNAYNEAANAYIERKEKEAEVVHAFEATRGQGARVRLVTIHAEGGMGKTRLAVTCAKRLAGLFPQGVWFVPLAEVSPNRQAVAEAIAAALKLSTPTEDFLKSYLHQSRELLLILDNVESVRCGEVQLLIADLLDANPELCLLATGREAIGVANVEKWVSVNEGMDLEEARDLFLDRAGLHATPPSTDDPALPGLLELTERIPLAIELLAAWWDTYGTLAEMAQDYAKAPQGELTSIPNDSSSPDDASAKLRHHSLLHSLNWSWEKLGQATGGEEAQQVFATVSLFGATFDAATVAAITQKPSVRAPLNRLLHTSLIRQEAGSNPTRYSLHRFTRAYAAERLNELPTAAETHQRFVAHYVQLVADNDNLNDAKHRAILTREWQNALAAVTVAEKEKWYAVVWLCKLGDFLHLRGLWSEEERLCLSALTAARAKDRQNEGVVLNSLGRVYQDRGQGKEAEKVFEQALSITQEIGDRQNEGVALCNLGFLYCGRGELDKAEQSHRQALGIFRELGDRRGEGGALNNLGFVYQSRGQWREAEQAYKQSLVIKHELHERNGEGNTLANLGIMHLKQHQLQEAESFLSQALLIFREIGNRLGEEQTLGHWGILYNERGQWDKAEQAYQQSLFISRDLGDRRNEGAALNNLGSMFVSLGQWEKAEQACELALQIFRELGDRRGEGMTLGNLGDVYQNRGQWEAAEKVYALAVIIFRELGDRQGEGRTRDKLGFIFVSLGQWKEAEQAYEPALQIFRELGDRRGEGITLNNLGVVYRSQYQWEKAEQVYEQYLQICRELGDRQGEGMTLGNFAVLLWMQGKRAEAIALAWESVRVLEGTEDAITLEKMRKTLKAMESA